jgi:hypothetical protein
MKLLLQTSIVVTLLMLGALEVQACSCAEPGQREKFRKADVIFLGEIIGSRFVNATDKDSMLGATATFSVKHQWKGSNQKQIHLLLTFDLPGMCGDMPLTPGLQYLVYANHEKEGLVSDTDCGPNIPAANASKDINNLNSFWFRLSARLWPFN